MKVAEAGGFIPADVKRQIRRRHDWSQVVESATAFAEARGVDARKVAGVLAAKPRKA